MRYVAGVFFAVSISYFIAGLLNLSANDPWSWVIGLFIGIFGLVIAGAIASIESNLVALIAMTISIAIFYSTMGNIEGQTFRVYPAQCFGSSWSSVPKSEVVRSQRISWI